MPPTSSQQQTHSHTQNHLAHDSVYARGSSTARVVRSPQHRMPVPDQPNYTPQPSMTPHYGPQPLIDGSRNIAPTQFGRGNGTYWVNSMNGFNYDTTGTLESRPLHRGVVVNIRRSSLILSLEAAIPVWTVWARRNKPYWIPVRGGAIVELRNESFAFLPGDKCGAKQPRSVSSLETIRLLGRL
ncbi:hypothetical protein EDB84DRAFT_1440858 [Lactarius hengduanensis]|nr:hypothetical protein EDB84DRAFT_1440858 [Lactarius hengduanensis]